MFGPVAYDRSRYRPSGGGEALFPTESVLGLTECGLTPAAAGLSLYFMSSLTARESAEAGERLCGKGPSASTLVQMSTEAGRRFEGCSGQLMAELHEDAVALHVSLDGVMVRMNAETVDGHAVEPGWREASRGVVAMLDAEGSRSAHHGLSPRHTMITVIGRNHAEEREESCCLTTTHASWLN